LKGRTDSRRDPPSSSSKRNILLFYLPCVRNLVASLVGGDLAAFFEPRKNLVDRSHWLCVSGEIEALFLKAFEHLVRSKWADGDLTKDGADRVGYSLAVNPAGAYRGAADQGHEVIGHFVQVPYLVVEFAKLNFQFRAFFLQRMQTGAKIIKGLSVGVSFVSHRNKCRYVYQDCQGHLSRNTRHAREALIRAAEVKSQCCMPGFNSKKIGTRTIEDSFVFAASGLITSICSFVAVGFDRPQFNGRDMFSTCRGMNVFGTAASW